MIWAVHHLLFHAALLLPAGNAATLDHQSAYETGMDLIRRQGAQAGIEFFESHSLATGELSSLFGMAWAYWKDNKAGDAEKITRFILGENPTDTVRAHCNYLLGYLLIQKNEHQTARAHFLEALPVYERKKWRDDIFNTVCGLAAASIFEKDLDTADRYLAQARQESVFIHGNLGFFFDLVARLAFARGDFEQALAASERGYRAYSLGQDEINMAIALSNVAFFTVLGGDLEQGLRRANEARALYERHNYTILSYYNLVNLVLIYRCRGLDYNEPEEKIRSWIATNEDHFLEDLLTFALNWDCRGAAPSAD